MRIASWNVAGLAKLLPDAQWGEFIDTYDICLFQETWCLVPFYKNGYTSFCVDAIKSPKGRPSGGLGIWVKTSLRCTISNLPCSSKNILALRLLFPTGLSIKLINVYNRVESRNNETSTIHQLEQQFLTPRTRDLILMAGDLNTTFEPIVAASHDLTLTCIINGVFPTWIWPKLDGH